MRCTGLFFKRTRFTSVFLATALLLLNACSKATTSLPAKCSTSTSGTLATIELTEIAAPSGSASGDAASEGPGPRRLLLASSTDGVSFTRLGKVLSDQANTPNMIVLPSGEILVYYTAYNIDPSASSSNDANRDGIAVARSSDNGATWRYYCVGMAGFSATHPPIGDPDVVRLDDGTFRMHVTNGTSTNEIHILSATSTDGVNFTKEGTSLNTGSNLFKDSLTTKIGGQWVMYVLKDNGQMLRATSADGKTFTMGTSASYNITVNSLSESFVLSNWFRPSSGASRVFAFSLITKDIRSFTTTDGLTLTPDSTVSLGLPLSSLEKSWVKDAAVQKLADGTYLMAYVAEIP